MGAQCPFSQGFTPSGLAGHFSGAAYVEGSRKLKPYQLVSVPRTTSQCSVSLQAVFRSAGVLVCILRCELPVVPLRLRRQLQSE